jgi:hypothetical protein
LRFQCGDLASAEVDPADLLLCIDVLEHVEDYLGLLRALRSRAVYKVFHIPLQMNALHILRNTPVASRSRLGHLHYFMKDTALATLVDAGYVVLDWSYTAGSLDLKKGGLGQRLLRVPRMVFWRIAPDFAVRLLGGYSLLVLAQ